MKNCQKKLTEALFQTKAIRVSPADKPFWYTSGKIGPYYINTHFLFGSEEKAGALLKLIDRVKEDKQQCSAIVSESVMENYREDEIFKATIDVLSEAIQSRITSNDIDYISGGERRDWFFSFAVSKLLNKPHITIFKDMDSYVYHQEKSYKTGALDGAKVLHIADLITSASSYKRAWVPVIKKATGKMLNSFVIIDRLQGGRTVLESLGVHSYSMVDIDKNVFKTALDYQYINTEQYRMVLGYMENPDLFMEQFFQNNPGFIKEALESDEKTARRARLCLESGFCPGFDGK